MPADYADHEFGDVISRYICPEDGCGRELRVEYRDGMPASMFGLACPAGHVGLGVRVRDAAALDEVADTEHVPRCWECQEQILGEEPTTVEGRTVHPGDCASDAREQFRRLEAIDGGGA